MTWDRGRLERKVHEILQLVFGLEPGQLGAEQTFAGDLMAESLDYVDIELHVRHEFGVPFDFAAAAEEIRASGVKAVRVRDLVDYLEPRVIDVRS